MDSLNGADHSRVIKREETHEGNEEAAGIQGIGVEVLPEGALVLIKTPGEHFLLDSIPGLFPGLAISRKAIAPGDGETPVQGYPAHHLGIEKIIRAAAHLPNAPVLFLPMLHHVIAQAGQGIPEVLIDLPHIVREFQGGIQDLAVNIKLALFRRGVPPAHRP